MKSDNSIQIPATQGKRIKALRKAKKLSQDELSSILDCHKNTISAWENDRDTPDRYFVVALANCFGCSADYLLGLSSLPQRADMPAPAPPATAAGRAFDELARQIAQKDPDALPPKKESESTQLPLASSPPRKTKPCYGMMMVPQPQGPARSSPPPRWAGLVR